ERLASRPASSFVADLAGANVLSGTARPGDHGLTAIALDTGGLLFSADPLTGRVGASVFPWEVELEPRGARHEGSAQNRLPVTVVSVTAIGNRVRVGLEAPALIVAEVTQTAAERLSLAPGLALDAIWKATATRLSPL